MAEGTLKKTLAAAIGVATLSMSGVAAAHWSGVRVSGGGGNGAATMSCPGGMASLAHVLNEDAPIFTGDPETSIEPWGVDYDSDGYVLEAISIGDHTSTHLDAPVHFVEGGRSIDELSAEEFVWPSYVIDLRDRMTGTPADGFALEAADIRAYERDHGRIPKGALVIVRTGLDTRYDQASTDDEELGTGYYADAPGFSGDAVQWMIDARRIRAIGSDTFGPDATSDTDYLATSTILANDGVAIPGLTNLSALSTTGDIVIAPAVRLENGSGYQVNPLACLRSVGSPRPGRGHGKHD